MKISLDKVSKLISNADSFTYREKSTAIYKLVYQSLRSAILQGDLPFNCELPPTRSLAEALGLSRSTIIKSYELLQMEGIIKSLGGSGSVVSYKAEVISTPALVSAKLGYPGMSKLGAAFYDNRNMVNPLDDNYISFRPGLPPLDVFPVEQWKKELNHYWSMIRASELTYHNTMGMDSLRISLANHLNLNHNIKCDYKQIAIVGGSLQSLFLIGSLMLNEGDGVYLEEQTFPNVHSVFKGLRAGLKPLPIDDEGVNPGQGAGNGRSQTKLIHTTPSCQYPLGMQMSLQRRQEIVEFAGKNNLYIIENDYEYEVNRTVDPLNSLFSLDKEDRTFYVSTFNRILHPSVRIGFMIVPNHLIESTQSFLRHSHMFVSPSIQMVLRSFLENKTLHKHNGKVIKALNERKAIFDEAFKKLGNPRVIIEFPKVPSLHMLIHLPAEVSDTQMADRLLEQGVLVHALSKCAVGKTKLHGLILGYASTRPQQIKPKLQKLLEELATV